MSAEDVVQYQIEIQEAQDRSEVGEVTVVFDLDGENLFVCDKCGFSTSFKAHLERHQATHSNEKPFKCPECDYRCREKVNLQKHLVIHRPEKPFACSMCSHRCKLQSLLNSHIRIVHSSLRPYSCNVCNYTCKTASNLRKHQWIHQGYKPFSCRFCPYIAREKNKMRRHEKFKHQMATEREMSQQDQKDQHKPADQMSGSAPKTRNSNEGEAQCEVNSQQNFKVEEDDGLARVKFEELDAEHSWGDYDISSAVGKTVFRSRLPVGRLQGNSPDPNSLTFTVQSPHLQSFIIL
ncbi:Zinc finger protein 513-like [Plakobranchus ocellatus]|uniref:Zinc finger protein 513-like n=1 Tax=Plakobranchus ocellatus TaxID=259542 RepID=A0AAV3ZN02_9GAST|nr:Zinc finger protein 513-like [Plakobranchus ocellatus]